jgi:hypothetical protein
MDFNENPVGTGSYGSLGHWSHQIPFAGGMAGIDDDRQMG